MKMTNMNDCFVLSNGVKIPCIGYGTFQTAPGDATRNCVKAALEQGYRHIDTASGYGNEEDVGAALKESGLKREEVFLTTKHWIIHRGYEKTLATIEDSLKKLGTDYLDLYLVHWPCVEKVTPQWQEINADTWRGFERAYQDGKIRAIGVSNYEAKHLEALDKFCTVKPMVNQLEYHPGYSQLDNVRYCQKRGMVVQAWSPLGSGAVLKDPTLMEMAAKYGKSVAQLCVRYALQNDVQPLPKSTNPERMLQNAQVFDFEISDDDMKILENMPRTGFSTWVPEEAPADALVK